MQMPPPSPWVPTTNSYELKVLGKLIEELNEASKAAARCIIQQIEEQAVPNDDGKVNGEKLHEELADVTACMRIFLEYFPPNMGMFNARVAMKYQHLSAWHDMLRSNLQGETK